jgi:hypothetical protein
MTIISYITLPAMTEHSVKIAAPLGQALELFLGSHPYSLITSTQRGA